MQNAVTPGLGPVALALPGAGVAHPVPDGDAGAEAGAGWREIFEKLTAEREAQDAPGGAGSEPAGFMQPEAPPEDPTESSSSEASETHSGEAEQLPSGSPSDRARGAEAVDPVRPLEARRASGPPGPAPQSRHGAGDAGAPAPPTAGPTSVAVRRDLPTQVTGGGAPVPAPGVAQQETANAEEIRSPTAGPAGGDTKALFPTGEPAREPTRNASGFGAEAGKIGKPETQPGAPARSGATGAEAGAPRGGGAGGRAPPDPAGDLRAAEPRRGAEVRSIEVMPAAAVHASVAPLTAGRAAALPVPASSQAMPNPAVAPISPASGGEIDRAMPALAPPPSPPSGRGAGGPAPLALPAAPPPDKEAERRLPPFDDQGIATGSEESRRGETSLPRSPASGPADWSSRIPNVAWAPPQALPAISGPEEATPSVPIVSGDPAGGPGEARFLTSAGAVSPPAGPAPGMQATVQGIAHQIALLSRPVPDGPIELHLRPAELGRLKLTFSSGDGGLVVNVVVERADTLDLLRRNVDLLAQDMRRMGQEGAQFSFQGGEDSGRAQHQRGSGGQTIFTTEESEAREVLASGDSGPARAAAPGLDLRL